MANLVSICVCTYRREMLRRTLASLARLTVPPGREVEVIVVDNDSDGSARSMVSDFVTSAPFQVVYALEPRKGLSFARNRGLETAKGQWIALIDDDEIAERDWLARLLETAELFCADAVVGAVLPEFEGSPPAWVVHSRFFDRSLPPAGTKIGMGIALSGNALLRADFLRARNLWFDPDFNFTGGEDSDFFRRFTDLEGTVVSAPDAVVREFVPSQRMTAEHLSKVSLWIGEIYARLTHKHGGLLVTAASVPRAAFNLIIATLLMAVSFPFGRTWYYRYYLLVLRNAGKFRYYLGLSPIEMYR